MKRILPLLLLCASPLSAQLRKTQTRAIVRDTACAPAAGWAARDTTYRTMTEATAASKTKLTCPVAPPPPPPPPADTQPTPPPAGVVLLFRDSFESGDFSAAQNGVRWTGTSYVDNTTAIARSGTRSARFKQGTPLGDGTWAELRFGGLPQLSEAFLQFYLYMPDGAESPSVGPRVIVQGSGNNKFFRLWADDYGSPPKFGASTWGERVGSEYTYTPDSGSPWGMGQGNPGSPEVPFIIDANKGRWVQVRIRTKVSGADNASGVIQLWADGVLLINDTALHVFPRGFTANYFANGYLLGYANSGFQPGQMMYVDDVTISTGGFAP